MDFAHSNQSRQVHLDYPLLLTPLKMPKCGVDQGLGTGIIALASREARYRLLRSWSQAVVLLFEGGDMIIAAIQA